MPSCPVGRVATDGNPQGWCSGWLPGVTGPRTYRYISFQAAPIVFHLIGHLRNRGTSPPGEVPQRLGARLAENATSVSSALLTVRLPRFAESLPNGAVGDASLDRGTAEHDRNLRVRVSYRVDPVLALHVPRRERRLKLLIDAPAVGVGTVNVLDVVKDGPQGNGRVLAIKVIRRVDQHFRHHSGREALGDRCGEDPSTFPGLSTYIPVITVKQEHTQSGLPLNRAPTKLDPQQIILEGQPHVGLPTQGRCHSVHPWIPLRLSDFRSSVARRLVSRQQFQCLSALEDE